MSNVINYKDIDLTRLKAERAAMVAAVEALGMVGGAEGQAVFNALLSKADRLIALVEKGQQSEQRDQLPTSSNHGEDDATRDL